MKKLFLIFAVSMLSVLHVTVSCTPEGGGDSHVDKVPLPSPSVVVQHVDDRSFSLAWEPVVGAVSYKYASDCPVNTEGMTSDTLLSFSGLAAGSTYTVSLSAVPASDAVMFEESPASEVTVTLKDGDTPEPEDEMFTIEIQDDPDMMVVTYTVTPKDLSMLFYRDCFTDSQWLEMGGNSEDVWTNALQGYLELFGTSWLYMVAESGVVESFFDYAYDQHTYILVAGLDSLANRITSVTDTVFYSGPVPPSDITFKVTVEDIGTSSAVVSVEPSNNDPYSMLLVESASLEGFSEADVEDLIRISYGEYINDGHVYQGSITMTYREGKLDPDTEYTVLVFGWNTTLSTDVSFHTFRTKEASSSSDLTFDWLIEVSGPTEIHAVVTPSDMDAQYIVVPMPDYDYEEFGSDIEAYIEYVTMGIITPYDYAYMFATTGVTDRIFDEFNDGIYPGSSYMFFAVGLDMDNSEKTVSFYEPQFYGDMVTTPDE